MAANDAATERINRKELPPDVTKWLPGAGLVAQGLQSFRVGGLRLPSITEQLRLPAFEHSGAQVVRAAANTENDGLGRV
jgi:hypothetical protein